VAEVDLGPLILSFRVPFDGSAWRNLALGAAIVAVPAMARFKRRSHWYAWDLLWPGIWLAIALVQSYRRTVRFYLNGVHLPAEQDRKARSRFLRWAQIERYHFDGAILHLEGTSDTLKGGPVAGTTIRVPTEYQAQVMSILAGNIR